MLHGSKCIFEKCLFLPAATNRGSAEKMLLWNYTSSLHSLCKGTARTAAVMSQRALRWPLRPSMTKPWPFQNRTSFYSKAEKGSLHPAKERHPLRGGTRQMRDGTRQLCLAVQAIKDLSSTHQRDVFLPITMPC